MPQGLYALAVLACPLGMGLMMWMMGRNNKQPADDSATRKAELTRMQAEIDQLRAAERERGGQPLTK